MVQTLETFKGKLSSLIDNTNKLKPLINQAINFYRNSVNPGDAVKKNRLENALMYVENSQDKCNEALNETETNQPDAENLNNWIESILEPLVEEADDYYLRAQNEFQNVMEESQSSVAGRERTSGEAEINITQDEIDDLVNNFNGNSEVSEPNVSEDNLSPLIKSFKKYFIGDNPRNLLYSLDFAKSMLNYFAPSRDIPEDPKDLLSSAKNLFDDEFQNHSYTDEKFVRFIVNKVNKEPGLMSYDMVADLVESDAYNDFGNNNKDDQKNKVKFERWVVNKSILSKVDKMPAVDVVNNESGMLRIVNKIVPDKNKEKYKEQIKQKITEFDTDYVDHLNQSKLNTIKDLVGRESSSNENHKEKLCQVYKVLCKDPSLAEIYRESLNTTYLGTATKGRAAVLLGYQTALNNCLDATCTRINKKEQFREQGIQVPSLSDFVIDPCNRPAVESGENKSLSLGYILKDCTKTFVKTTVGAAAITTIASLPFVGNIARGIIGIGSVVSAGITAGKIEYQKAKQRGNGVVSKKELLSIGLKSGTSIIGKITPYVASVVLDNSIAGFVVRGVSALTVAAKTLFKDLEVAAGFNKEESEFTNTVKRKTSLKAKFGRGINLLKKLKESWKGAKGQGRGKAVLHAIGKGAAVFAGGSLGVDLGSKLGSTMFAGQAAGLSQSDLHNQQDSQLTSENLKALDAMDEIDLTENARATADVANDRQYIDGVQKDWYSAEGQSNAIEILKENGVDDPMGVLRKVGSMARFEGGEYQQTLKNLCAGQINNDDVENIIESLNNIDRTGALKPLSGSGAEVRMPAEQVNFYNNNEIIDNVKLPKIESVVDQLTPDSNETHMVLSANTENNSLATKMVDEVRLPKEEFGTRLEVLPDTTKTQTVLENSELKFDDSVTMPSEQGNFNSFTADEEIIHEETKLPVFNSENENLSDKSLTETTAAQELLKTENVNNQVNTEVKSNVKLPELQPTFSF